MQNVTPMFEAQDVWKNRKADRIGRGERTDKMTNKIQGQMEHGLGGNSIALKKGLKISGPFSIRFSGALFVLLNQD